ncbi:MAG: Mini-ribonuclease 3 [Clostridiales bacterium]|nr:Mini-ribonuclease 3 [Clostridiales bacterium]
MIFNYTGKTLKPEEAKRINALSLAFIGDAVFEVMVREYLILNNLDFSAHKLHLKAVSYVKANSQRAFIRQLEKHLTEDELYIYKKGRNTKSATIPKNATVSDYRAATGFESLIGYLYITGQSQRIQLIMDIIFDENKPSEE